MIGSILYVLGIVLAIWCVYDIFTTAKCSTAMKIVWAVVVLLTSWIGFAVYYFFLRGKI